MPDPTPTIGIHELELRALALDYAHLRARDARAESLVFASIAESGQQHPAFVVRRDDGRYVLIDGYRRVRALKKLARDTVVVLAIGTSEADALAYCHRLATGRRRSVLEEGWLVRELCEVHGRTLVDIAVSLGRSRSWASRRLGLAQALSPALEEAVARGVVSPHGAMFSLLPLARTNKAHAEQIVAALGSTRTTTRQLAQVWGAYRVADGERRARIAQAPLLLLRAAEATAPIPSIIAVTRAVDAATRALGWARASFVAACAHDSATRVAPHVTRSIARAAEACAALVAAEIG